MYFKCYKLHKVQKDNKWTLKLFFLHLNGTPIIRIVLINKHLCCNWLIKAISYLEFNIVLFCKFIWIGSYVVIAYKIWVPYCALPSANRVWRLLNCIYRKREAALGACGRDARDTGIAHMCSHPLPYYCIYLCFAVTTK